MGGRHSHVFGAALVLVLGSCGQAPANGFVLEKLAFAEAQGDIQSGPTRVMVALFPDWGERMAKLVELRPSFRLDDDERIATRVLNPGFDVIDTDTGCSGRLTIALASAEIRFDEHTLFADQDGSRISCTDFVTDIETFVALGQEPQITATRRPRSTPQDPRDPGFLADAIQLDDEDVDGDQRPQIELNVSAANLATCADMSLPPSGCAGAFRIFDLLVPVAHDRTDIHRSDPEPRLEVRFDGIVQRADGKEHEVRLNTGAVVRMVEGSQLMWGSAPPSELFTSLSDVQDGVEGGREVEAHGRAAVISTDPLVLWVNEIEFEIERDLPPTRFQALVSLEGAVVDTDTTDSYVDLPFRDAPPRDRGVDGGRDLPDGPRRGLGDVLRSPRPRERAGGGGGVRQAGAGHAGGPGHLHHRRAGMMPRAGRPCGTAKGRRVRPPRIRQRSGRTQRTGTGLRRSVRSATLPRTR